MDASPKKTYRAMDLPKIGEVLEERYRLERVIGKGGMGLVVEAEHLRLERPVAIKLMHQHLAKNEDFVGRFRREVLIAKQIEHPNTVRIYDFGMTASGIMYLVMEYLQGRELKDLIGEGPVSLETVCELGVQILDGLAEAHAIDVVHRDLKPGNVFICDSRRGRQVAKLLDFGIAKSLGAVQQSITATGDVVGTGPYLAPELFLDDACSKAADVYACGLILFEMLTSRRLMAASSMGRTMTRHLKMPIVLPSPLDTHPLGEVLLGALAKSPGERFADAEVMLDALQSCAQSCDDTRLASGDIDAAFEAMEAGFEHHARRMLPDDAESAAQGTTMTLDESDVELLDSETLSRPRTPTGRVQSSVTEAIPRTRRSGASPRPVEPTPRSVQSRANQERASGAGASRWAFWVAASVIIVGLIGLSAWLFASDAEAPSEPLVAPESTSGTAGSDEATESPESAPPPRDEASQDAASTEEQVGDREDDEVLLFEADNAHEADVGEPIAEPPEPVETEVEPPEPERPAPREPSPTERPKSSGDKKAFDSVIDEHL